MNRLGFWNQDERLFAANDLCWGPDPLWSAIEADADLEAEWNEGEPFESPEALVSRWVELRNASAHRAAVLTWALCIEYAGALQPS